MHLKKNEGFLNLIYNIILISSLIFSASLSAATQWAQQNLTPTEQDYLNSIKSIKKCVDPLWMPMEAIKGDKHVGVIADLLSLVETKIGVPFSLVKTQNWPESLEKLKARQCDIVTSDAATGNIPDWYLKTVAFIDQQIVYITRKSSPFQVDFSLIKDKTIGIPRGYPIIEIIKKEYGDVNIIEVDDVDSGLLMVSRGELFAFVDILSIVTHSIQEQKLTNLKVGGHLKISAPTVMAVRSDRPVLLNILNKAFNSIDHSVIHQLLSNWIKIEYDTKLNVRVLSPYILGFVFLLALILYWNRKLRLVNKKLDLANAELEVLQETDALTNTKNRHFMIHQVPELVKLARRNSISLGVALLDIDHFKKVNDRYGHAVGDECLVIFSQAILKEFQRDTDWVIRYGGEEFVVICFGMSDKGFVESLERLRTAIEQIAVPVEAHNKKVSFTVSIGSCFKEEVSELWNESMIREADKRLYRAKNSGRNRLISS